jgi:hypothetical protein
VSTPVDDITALRIPKLSAGSSFESYVQQEGDIATVEKAKVADPKQIALSNTLHTVGIKKSNKVSNNNFISISRAMRKIIPTQSA